MNLRRLFILFTFSISSQLCLAQESSWIFSLGAGAPYNFKTPLTIRQNGFPDIVLKKAEYRTEPFNSPPYYDVRIEKWKENKGIGAEFVHHKIILENLPDEVQQFSITHGFNLFTINRIWDLDHVVLTLGGGVVYTHPESEVRGKEFGKSSGVIGKGYYISGPTFNAGLSRKIFLIKDLFFWAEGKFTASYVRVRIHDGHATLPNIAVHGQSGLGYQFGRKKSQP